MYAAAQRLLRASSSELDVFEVSGEAFRDLLPWRSYANTRSFENARSIDLCSAFVLAKQVDLIVLDQVLEHVRKPTEALRNCARNLVRGGHVFIATPFLIRVHPAPDDYWRWTEQGLCALLDDNGFRVESSGAWGNRSCVVANFDDFPMVKPGDAMQNEADFPVTVWALATVK